ncbi:MAG: hypothetical protein JXA97_00230 [Anaerolineales bacterium]|nr:hypothetical protein [Anaerolineales bacterium]
MEKKTSPEQLAHIISAILVQYRLPVYGTHGITHWARVYENGMRLARYNGADRQVVALFSVFHDACRWNEDVDPGHGRRGAELAIQMQASLSLRAEAFETLLEACRLHTDGFLQANDTIQTCWDADRLDLPRVGIPIRQDRLCTPAARQPDLVAWASDRAKNRFVPTFVQDSWMPDQKYRADWPRK